MMLVMKANHQRRSRGPSSRGPRALVLSVIGSVFVLGCSVPPSKEDVGERAGSVASPVLNGHDSSDDAAVRVESADADGGTVAICSGHLVAPNLVVTARHCVLLIGADKDFFCNPDGTLKDPTDPRGQETTVIPPSRITTYVGANKENVVGVRANQVLTEEQVGRCKSDIAFLVLERPAFDVHVPLRAGPVRVGETFSITGWGYTSDDAAAEGRTALPDGRQVLDAVEISQVGPGLIPADSFAINGNTLCYGDSGSGAMIGGALVGVYSRIYGPSCSASQTQNIFTMIGPHLDLVRSAFAAAGATPLFEGSSDCDAGSLCDAGATQLSDAEVSRAPQGSSSGDDASCTSAAHGHPRSPIVPMLALMPGVLFITRRRSRSS